VATHRGDGLRGIDHRVAARKGADLREVDLRVATRKGADLRGIDHMLAGPEKAAAFRKVVDLQKVVGPGSGTGHQKVADPE